VYEAMKEEIITGQLPPGSIISELALAERYQTSRTPVREACQFLQKDGLLEGRTAQRLLRRRDHDEAGQDIYQLRLVLEGTCARSLPIITRSELGAGSARTPDHTFTASIGNRSAAAPRLNRRFHLRIAEITGNQELIRSSRISSTKSLAPSTWKPRRLRWS
jgi:DNA-binding GntR family transcriptional regulator